MEFSQLRELLQDHLKIELKVKHGHLIVCLVLTEERYGTEELLAESLISLSELKEW
jgi:hypothetical protein